MSQLKTNFLSIIRVRRMELGVVDSHKQAFCTTTDTSIHFFHCLEWFRLLLKGQSTEVHDYHNQFSSSHHNILAQVFHYMGTFLALDNLRQNLARLMYHYYRVLVGIKDQNHYRKCLCRLSFCRSSYILGQMVHWDTSQDLVHLCLNHCSHSCHQGY